LWKKLKYGPPEHLHLLEQIFEKVAIDGSSAFIPGQESEERDNDNEDDEFDGSPMSTSSHKRPISNNTTATSPCKKTKSPMVRIMKNLVDNFKVDSASTQKVLQGDHMGESMDKALDLAVECGAPEDSIEYFMATQLFLKAENRQIFMKFSTKEARLFWLKRWCQMTKMY